MRAGERNRPVDLLSPPVAPTGFSDPWVGLARIWAHREPDPAGDGTYTVNVLHRDDVAPYLRIQDGSLLLEVQDVRDPTGRRAELELRCVEVKPKTAAVLRSYVETYTEATRTNTRLPTDLAVECTVEAYDAAEIDGTLIQRGDLKVTLEAWGLPSAPTLADTFVLDGEWSVKAVSPLYDRGAVRRYVLQVRR